MAVTRLRMPSVPGMSGSVSAALASLASPASTPTSDMEDSARGCSTPGGPCGPVVGQVAGSGGHIRVAVRVRPLPFGDDGIIEVAGQGAIAIRKGPATGGNEFLKSQQGKVEERMFDRVFGPEASQSDVYSWTCAPLVAEAVSRGRSATVFVYGATGAGKTHTMFGSSASRDQRGLIFRTIPDVFGAIDTLSGNETGGRPSWVSKGGDGSFEVKVSFLEIYNENVRDLLRPDATSVPTCRVLEDARRGLVEISNLVEAPVQNSDEALWYLQAGIQARTVEATAANAQSSRSHAVFTLTVEHIRRKVPGRGHFQRCAPEVRTQHAKISLIDLAGSERAAITKNSGSALKDGARINQSLLALANCIDALTARGRDAATQRKKPPYRDSKLTLMLKGSLTGDGLVAMIANVHPGRTHFEDSNNTLEYAQRASVVKSQPIKRVVRRSAPGHLAHMSAEEESQSMVSSPLMNPPKQTASNRRRRKSEDADAIAWPAATCDVPDATTASSPDECLSELSLSCGGEPECSDAASSPDIGADGAPASRDIWEATLDEEAEEDDDEVAVACDDGTIPDEGDSPPLQECSPSVHDVGDSLEMVLPRLAASVRRPEEELVAQARRLSEVHWLSTVSDLQDLEAVDWPRLGLPLKLERALRNLIQRY